MIPLLRFASVYRAFGCAIGGQFRDLYVQQYVRPAPGDRILDIGCGPGDILDHLPEVDYLGIDIEPGYIDAARSRFAGRGEFRCESATQTVLREPGSFDLVMANGLLHHLNDEEAQAVLELARDALEPTGKLVALDGGFVTRQSALERLLLRMDRGRFVRSPEEYVRLASRSFRDVISEVRHDLLRLPYTHHIMTCRP